MISQISEPKQHIIDSIIAVVDNFRECLSENEVPLVYSLKVDPEEVDAFRASMPRTTLVTVYDPPFDSLTKELDLISDAAELDARQRRQIRSALLKQFAAKATASDAIILDPLDRVVVGSPAQGFLDAAFFNSYIAKINGQDKIFVRSHLSLIVEDQEPLESADILEFR